MPERVWLDHQAQVSLARLQPRLAARLAGAARPDWEAFNCRLEANFSRLVSLLFQLYGQQYDFFYLCCLHLSSGRICASWP